MSFISIGQFVSGPGWRHMRRTMDSFELVFVRRGILPIRIGDRELDIADDEIALVPPVVEHAGTRIITEDLEFYWMHVLLPPTRTVDDGDIPQDDHCLVLPHWCKADDPGRLSVLCGQLIDLYARFGPHANAYCDYFATSVLLEVSAQARAEAYAAGALRGGSGGGPGGGAGIAGFHADGRLVLEGGESGLGPMLAIRAWLMAKAFDDITVAGVAERFHYSPSYLTAMYKRVFGIGIVEQITEYRIDHARELLSTTTTPVADVARESGYDDPKYFMRVFKRRTGLTPGQYRDAFPKRLYNTV